MLEEPASISGVGFVYPVVSEAQPSVQCSDVQAAQFYAHSKWCTRSIATSNQVCCVGEPSSTKHLQRIQKGSDTGGVLNLIMRSAAVFKTNDLSFGLRIKALVLADYSNQLCCEQPGLDAARK